MKLYWKTRNGRVLDVDLMTDLHVRNAFKFLLNKYPQLAASEKDVNEVRNNFITNIIPEDIFGYKSNFNMVKENHDFPWS